MFKRTVKKMAVHYNNSCWFYSDIFLCVSSEAHDSIYETQLWKEKGYSSCFSRSIGGSKQAVLSEVSVWPERGALFYGQNSKVHKDLAAAMCAPHYYVFAALMMIQVRMEQTEFSRISADHTAKQADRETETNTGRQTGEQQAKRQADKQTDRQRTDRQTDRQIDGKTERQTGLINATTSIFLFPRKLTFDIASPRDSAAYSRTAWWPAWHLPTH